MALTERIHLECIERSEVLIELDKEHSWGEKKTECNHIPISTRLDGRSVRRCFLLTPLLFNINYCSFHTFCLFTRHICPHSTPFKPCSSGWLPSTPLNWTPSKVSLGQKIICLFEHPNFKETSEMKFIHLKWIWCLLCTSIKDCSERVVSKGHWRRLKWVLHERKYKEYCFHSANGT